MTSFEDAPADDRVSRERQITFTRDPRQMDWVAAQFPAPETEQDIIKAGLWEIATQRERGLTPEGLLETFEQFVAASSGAFRGRVEGEGDVCFVCGETGAALEFRETDDGGELSIDVRVEIPDGE
ncbi:hypothetical protein [Natrinema pallidum]|uniref:Uncharacterized protein n=1 Tax=Natrinema pallidum DSM 3751 TaxID=1227495 RepID=L9YHN7_9EURY|nr:hypothetical protein [Natrinema pallidum]ELY73216.1 hypothetical protein C487_17480 [Natrinema pallidum DSM 3751]